MNGSPGKPMVDCRLNSMQDEAEWTVNIKLMTISSILAVSSWD